MTDRKLDDILGGLDSVPPLLEPEHHEPTRQGVAPQGKLGPKRSITPWETTAVRAQVERDAIAHGEVIVEPPQSVAARPPAAVISSSNNIQYGIDPGTRNWIVAILGMLGVTGGVAVYGAVRDPVPEKVKEAPAVVNDQQRDIDVVRRDLGECRSDVHDLKNELKRTNKNVESLTGKLQKVEDRLPRIEGVPK